MQEIKARHTTTAARLYHFEEGGDLIDSPGIREFDLEHLDQETLLEVSSNSNPSSTYAGFGTAGMTKNQAAR